MSKVIRVLDGAVMRPWDIRPEEWDQMKAAHVVGQYAECHGNERAAVVPKTSINGTQFFAYAPGVSGWAPESIWHMRVKAAVLAALRSAGAEAQDEKPGWAPKGAWQADVYGEHAGRKFAVEVQRSQQTLAHYLRRQEKYESCGVEASWLVYPDHFHALLRASGRRRMQREGASLGTGFFPALAELPAMMAMVDSKTDALGVGGPGSIIYDMGEWCAGIVAGDLFWHDGVWELKHPR